MPEVQGKATTPGARRFGRINWLGLFTLSEREVKRFTSVWTQTILAPLITAGLFLLVFNLAIGAGRGEVFGVSFIHFLAPGILMMSVVQNAFANTASSLVISKIQGNIVDTLMPPLSAFELTIGYTLGGTLRGLAVATTIMLVAFPILGLSLAHPLWTFGFLCLGAMMLSLAGILAGIASDRFDQMNAITNFIITPLSFLSGTFYSIALLPPSLHWIAVANPVFYLIDGTRFAIIGASDADPVLGLAISIGVNLVLFFWVWRWFASGFRLKS